MNVANTITPAAPIIPVADYDGLIKVSDLMTDIAIHIPIGNDVKPGDRYELTVNGERTAKAYTVPAPMPLEDCIVLNLEPHWFTHDGSYKVGYEWKTFPGGIGLYSLTTPVHVDRIAPGATMLAQAVFPHINFGDKLAGSIPGYAGMQPGDVIQTICNGVQGPALVTSPDHLTEHPIQITFDRPFLDSLNSEFIRISYHVTDRAGNRSIEAEAVNLTYQRSMPAN
jgi:hypothetical protein